MLDNLFIVAMLIAVTIAVTSTVILIAGRGERPSVEGESDDTDGAHLGQGAARGQ